jgi:hypothetical protein
MVDYCYALGGAPELKALKERSDGDFQDLAHFFGRLGATRAAVNTVVTAMKDCPSLRQIRGIRTIEPPGPKLVTLRPEDMSPYEIVRAIGKVEVSQNMLDIRSALHELVEVYYSTFNIIQSSISRWQLHYQQQSKSSQRSRHP